MHLSINPNLLQYGYDILYNKGRIKGSDQNEKYT